ncbi:MAG: 2-oxo acid dehydrogenase subunit E2 [Oscillospiraceae bacterium]|nr:2-oxo acid dehydrogenase subunit E2 [Oscillospiraceae bacterium]
MFGRRPDGRRIKGIDPIVQITPYIMPMRCDAQVFLKHQADLEKISRYIRRALAEKNERLSHMNVIVAAYVRAVSRNPEVNRFIMNKQYFSRNNCSVALTILKDPNDADQGESVVRFSFDLTDTIFDVRDRMESLVASGRGDQPKTFLDKLAAALFKVPGLPTVAVALVRLLDRYGLCPGALIRELPFHVGMYITNTASIGLHDVNHHIYNFGNVSMFFSMGLAEKVAVVENGEARMKRLLPIGVVVDERVCSGAHYARFFNDMRRYLDHPELLEAPPEEVRFDPGCEYHVAKPERTQ